MIKEFFIKWFSKPIQETKPPPRYWQNSWRKMSYGYDDSQLICEPWATYNKYNVIQKFIELNEKYPFEYPFMRSEGCRSYIPSYNLVLIEILNYFQIKICSYEQYELFKNFDIVYHLDESLFKMKDFNLKVLSDFGPIVFQNYDFKYFEHSIDKIKDSTLLLIKRDPEQIRFIPKQVLTFNIAKIAIDEGHFDLINSPTEEMINYNNLINL